MNPITPPRPSRREVLLSTLAAAAWCGASPVLGAGRGLDPLDPDIRFGTTGSIFATWAGTAPTTLALQMSSNMRMMLLACKAYGLEGFEPYSSQVSDYVGRPADLKRLLTETGMTLASVGDLPRSRSAPAPATTSISVGARRNTLGSAAPAGPS